MQNTVTISVMVCYFVVFTTAANLNGVCTSNTDCTVTDSYCEKMFSNCDKGKCRCKDGYSSINGGMNGGSKCVMNRGNGDPCEANDCMQGFNCSNKVCCEDGSTYNANLKKCIKTGLREIGATCSTTSDCYDARHDYAECVADSGTTTPKYCRCLSGYITESYKCRKPHASETCSTGVGCRPVDLDIEGFEIETCSDGKCTCPSTSDMLTATFFGSTYPICVTKSTENKADGATCSNMYECNSKICDKCPGGSTKICLRPIEFSISGTSRVSVHGTSRVTGLTLALGLLIFVGFL